MNESLFMKKVYVRITISLLPLIIKLLVVSLFAWIFDWDCRITEISILLKVVSAYFALISFFLAYIISSKRNRCCSSKRVKNTIFILLTLTIIFVFFSVAIEVSCSKKENSDHCETNEASDLKSEQLIVENQYNKVIFLAFFANSNEKFYNKYLYFEVKSLKRQVTLMSSSAKINWEFFAVNFVLCEVQSEYYSDNPCELHNILK